MQDETRINEGKNLGCSRVVCLSMPPRLKGPGLADVWVRSVRSFCSCVPVMFVVCGVHWKQHC